MGKIDYSKRFLKQFRKAPLKIKIAFRNRFKLFLENPNHPQLNNHSLTGEFLGYRSFNVTGNWRAIFSEYKDEEGNTLIVFEMLGTHNQLYK